MKNSPDASTPTPKDLYPKLLPKPEDIISTLANDVNSDLAYLIYTGYFPETTYDPIKPSGPIEYQGKEAQENAAREYREKYIEWKKSKGQYDEYKSVLPSATYALADYFLRTLTPSVIEEILKGSTEKYPDFIIKSLNLALNEANKKTKRSKADPRTTKLLGQLKKYKSYKLGDPNISSENVTNAHEALVALQLIEALTINEIRRQVKVKIGDAISKV